VNHNLKPCVHYDQGPAKIKEQAQTTTKNGKVPTTDEMYFNSITNRPGQICEFCWQLPNSWRYGIYAADWTTVGQISKWALGKTE